MILILVHNTVELCYYVYEVNIVVFEIKRKKFNKCVLVQTFKLSIESNYLQFQQKTNFITL